MNLTFDEYLQDLGLENLAETESLDALSSVAITVHKQFLLGFNIAKIIPEFLFECL